MKVLSARLTLFYLIFVISYSALADSSKSPAENWQSLSISEMLELADEVRSSNSELSNKIINHLQQQKLNDQQQSKLTYLQAYQFTFLSDYDSAITLLNQLTSSAINTDLKLRSYYTLLNLYTAMQNWQAGIEQLTHSVELSQHVNNKDYIIAYYLSAANFYNQLGQYQLALDSISGLKSQNTSARNLCIITLHQLQAELRIYLSSDEKNNPTASHLATQIPRGVEICKTAKANMLTNIIRTYQAELALSKKDTKQAISSLLPFLEEILKTQYPVLITLSYNLLAQAYWQQGDISNSEKYALLALENSELVSETQQTVATFKLLFQLAEHNGNYKKAFELHKEYSLAKQKVNDEEQAKELAFQLASQKDFANKTEIKTLTRANDILTNEQSLNEQQQENSLLLLLLLLTVVGLGVTWGYKTWLSQQKLKQLTEFDDLTQAHSRRHFIALAQQIINQCQIERKPLTCLVFDLDRFKKINDNFGHHTGDAVLKEVANTCKQVCRPTDILGRLGGEEFAIILPYCELLMGEDLANRCREKIAQIDYKKLGLIEPITASFGITCTDVSGFELNKLLADADDAMYSAKQHGRNCVQAYK